MNYREKFDEIEKLKPQIRGTEFEKLLTKIVDDKGFLISNRFRTKDTEQEIDGAMLILSKIFLLEVKWEKDKTLAASKLFSFLGKINSKLEGTLGVFISYYELSENFISAFRNGLRQNCILVHGPTDVINIVEERVDIQKYFEYCYIQASLKNRVYISTSEFLAVYNPPATSAIAGATLPNHWMGVFTALTDNSIDLKAFTLTITATPLTGIGNKVIDVYNTIVLDALTKSKLTKLIEILIQNETEEFTEAVAKKLQGSYWQQIADEFFPAHLQGKLVVTPEVRQEIIKNVIQVLGKSQFESENEAARIINLFYSDLTIAEKSDLANEFLDIYLDTLRVADKPQKQLASKIINDVKNHSGGSYFNVIKDEISEQIRLYKLEEYFYKDEADDENSMQKFTKHRIIQKYRKAFEENQFTIEARDKFFDEEYIK